MAKKVRRPPPVNRYGTPDQQDRTRGAYPNRPGSKITEDDPRYVPRGKLKHKPKGPLEYRTPYQQHT